MAGYNRAIDDFCRLCAVESQSGVTIYSTEGENLCLEEKIFSCLRIEISRDDMLPKRVCHSCNLLLEDYYRFSERATQVQQTLYFLLGLHLPHPHEEDTELCLMENGVKVESNVIKKEMDEFIVHHGNIVHIEGEKFDLLLPQESSIKDQKHYCNIRDGGMDVDNKGTQDNDIGVTIGGDSCILNSDTKMNRRKILPPKKSMQNKLDGNNKSKGLNYVIEENDRCKEYFQNQNCEPNLHQDINERNYTIRLFSSEEEEEDEEEDRKQMALVWRNKWGITCNLCKNVLYDRFQFDTHYRNVHNNKPVYTCSYCQKSLNRHATYRLHIFEHINNGRFKCKFCTKKFLEKEMLQIHLEYLHNQMKVHICDECGKSFTTQLRLDLHLKKHATQTHEDLQCSECGKVLQTRGGLAAHKSVHKLGRHFMCHICGKTFTQKINMQQHVKHHKGERPHTCDICQKSFTEKSHLSRHKSFHTKERLFQCQTCQKMYKTERCLKVHSQIHWNSRPYICSICGKGFLSSTKLKQHHNCHTGERPFACKYCERTFTNYPNWMKHTRRRHKVDHKTGLSLQGEYDRKKLVVPSEGQMLTGNAEMSHEAIEFIEIPDVEVKEDGRDSVQSQHSVFNMVAPTILDDPQFQIIEGNGCQYQMNLLPDLVASQMGFSEPANAHNTTLL